jgi:phosphatidylserine/phosphatidylglycerophosphate/cardiolipin synthase-like enzyme
MFLSSENYFKEIQKLVRSGSNLSLAVAFWGEGGQSLIKSAYQGQKLRLLCNLGSGGTNPHVLEDLRKFSLENTEIELRCMDTLHAKLAIGENSAIVGSANVSANGLGLERSECATWEEAGYLVRDGQQIAAMQDWFERVWRQSEPITEKLLKNVEAQWLKNRASRPSPSKSFIEASSTELKNRGIAIAIYQEAASQKAKDALKQIKDEAAQSTGPVISNLDFFEDWPDDEDDKTQSLPKDAPIIVVRYGSRGRVSIDYVARRIPLLDRLDPDSGWSMTILGREKMVDGLQFTRADAKKFAERLKPWVEYEFPDKKLVDGKCFPLDDFLDWEAHR